MEINTKKVVSEWKQELKNTVERLVSTPTLEIIVADGYSEASTKYVNNKVKLAEELGIEVILTKIQWEGRSREDLLAELRNEIKDSSQTTDIHGIIVQLPFPHVSEKEIARMLPAEKDVDGFTNEQNRLLIDGDKKALVPCTAKGVMKLIKAVEGNNLKGKSISIVNRSNLIGMPLFYLALQENMTPTICHSKTEFIYTHFRNSDIIVTGCGQRGIYKSSYFPFNPTIIDCSTTPVEGKKGVGDCDKEEILLNKPGIKIASGYGHTGPMTVCALMDNVIQAYLQQGGRECF